MRKLLLLAVATSAACIHGQPVLTGYPLVDLPVVAVAAVAQAAASVPEPPRKLCHDEAGNPPHTCPSTTAAHGEPR